MAHRRPGCKFVFEFWHIWHTYNNVKELHSTVKCVLVANATLYLKSVNVAKRLVGTLVIPVVFCFDVLSSCGKVDTFVGESLELEFVR